MIKVVGRRVREEAGRVEMEGRFTTGNEAGRNFKVE